MVDLRILLLSPRISGVGGIAQHVRQLAIRLRKMGNEVDVVSTEIMKLRLGKGLANIGYGIISSMKILGEEYDIVHGHNLPSIIAVSSARAYVKILTLHGVYSKQITLLYGRIVGGLAEIFERYILRGLDVVTAVSMHAVKYYQSLGIRTIHIPNAIDLSEMPREGERVSEPQITYLGRLSKEKGVDLLIGAALRGLRGLVIAGDGPMRPLIEYAARRGLLKFLGPLPREKALKILAGSDVAVLPSREEGLSTMILEAMALRIPIVATRVGGTVEVLEHGKDAVLVNANPDEIKQAVKHLLEDETYSRYLVENAYQKLIKHYNWDIIEQQYMKLYKKALEDRVSNV